MACIIGHSRVMSRLKRPQSIRVGKPPARKLPLLWANGGTGRHNSLRSYRRKGVPDRSRLCPPIEER